MVHCTERRRRSLPLTALPPRPAPTRAAPALIASRLVLAALLLPALVLLASAGLLARQVLAEQEAELARAADATAEYARRVLDGHALRIARVNALLAGETDAAIRAEEARWHAALRVAVAAEEGLTVAVMDRDARLLASASTLPVPDGSFEDRDDVLTLRAAQPGARTLSALHAHRGTGERFFAVSAHRTGSGNGLPPDAFDGLVSIAVFTTETGAALRRLSGQPDLELALLRADGALLASSGPLSPGGSVPSREPVGAALAAGAAAFAGWQAAGDGRPARLVAGRRVEGWPAYAMAARDRGALARRWAAAVAPQALVAVPAAFALLWLAIAAERRGRRATETAAALAATQQGLEESVARRTAELAGREAMLRHVQRVGRIGGFEIDLRSGRNQRSPEYMALQGCLPRAALERHDDWVARLHAEDRARAERRFLDAIAPGGPADYAQDYRIRTPEGETRWIAARAEIERDAAGRALRLVGAHVDVTELKRAEEALAASEQRLRLAQEAAQVGTWEWEETTGRHRWSPEQAALFGLPRDAAAPENPEAFLALLHPEDVPAARAAHEAGLATGVYDAEFRVPQPQGGVRWLIGRGRRLGPPGAGRFIGVNVDITERKLAEERLALMAREADHRAKNVLAVAQAALRLTRADDLPSYARMVEGRIAALARTHTLLAAEAWRGAELRQLIEGELGHFLSPPGEPPPGEAHGAPRVVLEGPPVTLPAPIAQPLSMVLHELATNAAKYGALAVPEGRIAIAWSLGPDRRLRLAWTERGGPAVTAAPDRRGFGTRVIEATLRGQLDGRIVRDWRPEGLAARIEIPLDPRGGAADGTPATATVT